MNTKFGIPFLIFQGHDGDGNGVTGVKGSRLHCSFDYYYYYW
jgi:hypothetical protein